MRCKIGDQFAAQRVSLNCGQFTDQHDIGTTIEVHLWRQPTTARTHGSRNTPRNDDAAFLIDRVMLQYDDEGRAWPPLGRGNYVELPH